MGLYYQGRHAPSQRLGSFILMQATVNDTDSPLRLAFSSVLPRKEDGKKMGIETGKNCHIENQHGTRRCLRGVTCRAND